jgi:small subunit ribosomal protein S35
VQIIAIHPSRQIAQQSLAIAQTRWYSRRRNAGSNASAAADQLDGDQYESLEDTMKDLTPEQLEVLENLAKEFDPHARNLKDVMSTQAENQHAWRRSSRFTQLGRLRSPKVNRRSFWFDDDDPESFTEGVSDEFKEDDITSMAHGKLDEIREYRHYARIAAWEMPLLSSKEYQFRDISR